MLDIFREIKYELSVVEKELRAVAKTPDPILTETSTQLISAGGKRLRPAFCLLSGKFCNFDLKKLLPLAVALELIHMSSLVHDDVVDSSMTRRGIPTIKAKWGNKISTYVGDYFFAKSLILISTYEEPLISRVLADTSVKMCEGEIQQISTAFRTDQTIKDYFYRISRKTALLIAASCQLGAVACGAPPEIYIPLRRYGYNIGMAFQITDDVLDMTAEQHKLGKPIGGDLRQGIITIPAIFALKKHRAQNRLRELVAKQEKTEVEIHEIIEMIKECGGIDFARHVAQRFILKAKNALNDLPDVPAKETMLLIADFISTRKF